MTQTGTIKRIGHVGLGIMERAAMAANLIKAGFEVTVWNRTPGGVSRWQNSGRI
ncbi:MAG: NAD(P)-binding domain-containing protein [Phycisphaerales bacterium]